MAQIAERGGKSLTPREEVFVDAEHPRARFRASVRCLPPQKIQKPAFYGGASDLLPLSQPLPADAVVVFLEHAPPERLGSSFSGMFWEAYETNNAVT